MGRDDQTSRGRRWQNGEDEQETHTTQEVDKGHGANRGQAWGASFTSASGGIWPAEKPWFAGTV